MLTQQPRMTGRGSTSSAEHSPCQSSETEQAGAFQNWEREELWRVSGTWESDWAWVICWRLWFSKVKALLPPPAVMSAWSGTAHMWLMLDSLRRQPKTQSLCLCVHSKTPRPHSSHKHLLFIYTHICTLPVHKFCPCEPQCLHEGWCAKTEWCVSKPRCPGSLQMWYLLLKTCILSSEISAKITWWQWDQGFLIRERFFWPLGEFNPDSFWEEFQAWYKKIFDSYPEGFTSVFQCRQFTF